jgi:hypothetical protein
MIAEILAKYLKKVKDFANEKSSFEICKNVKIQANDKEIILYCCDGESGIKQRIKNNHGTPLIGEFCVNVFNFYKIVSNLPKQADVLMKLNTDNWTLNLKTDAFKFKLNVLPPDKIFELKEHDNWNDTNGNFFDRLKSVVPLCLHENYPIVYNGEYIYYVSPHAIIYVPLESKIPPFKTNTKIAVKIFTDLFDRADANENQIFFANEHCEIFIPQLVANAPKIEQIADKVKEFHKIVVDVNTSELFSAFNVIESLHDLNEYGLRNIDMIFEKNTLLLKYDAESEFLLADIKYTHPEKTVIKIPFDHLKVITAPEFIREANYVKILLAENTTMFVSQKGPQLTFVGGLSR